MIYDYITESDLSFDLGIYKVVFDLIMVEDFPFGVWLKELKLDPL